MRDFRLQFDPAGTFTLSGDGWPAMAGSVEDHRRRDHAAESSPGRRSATAPRATRVSVEGARFGLDVVADDCDVRRMILDRSRWLPPGHGSDRCPRDRADRRSPQRRRSSVPRRAPATGRRSAAARHRASARSRTCPTRGIRRPASNILWQHADPRTRALEPDRLGRHDLRDQRDQRQGQRDVQAGTLRRRRRIRRSIAAALDALRDRQAHAARSAGSAPRRKASRATSVTSSPPTPAPRRPPTAASSSRGSDRRASTPTTSTADCAGRSISAASTWARTTFPPTNGDRRARRSSGTAW